MSFMCTRGVRPTSVPPLIELRDGHGSRAGDLTAPRSRPSTPKGAAAIGGAAPIPEPGPPGGVHQSPELRAPVRNTADRAVLAELLFPAEFCNTLMAGAIQLVQGVEPCGKKGVALLKRPRRGWFGIVRPDPHGSQNSQTWLRNSCDRWPDHRRAHPGCDDHRRGLTAVKATCA
jgi:hypothetical protein